MTDMDDENRKESQTNSFFTQKLFVIKKTDPSQYEMLKKAMSKYMMRTNGQIREILEKTDRGEEVEFLIGDQQTADLWMRELSKCGAEVELREPTEKQRNSYKWFFRILFGGAALIVAVLIIGLAIAQLLA